MSKFLSDKGYLSEAKNAKFKPNVFLQILIFVGVFFVTQLASGIPSFIYSMIESIKLVQKGYTQQEIMNAITSSKETMVISLLSTVIVTIIVIVYCRFVERRSLKSMGFVKKNAFKQYMIGVGVGFSIFSIAVLICVVTGTLKYEGFILKGNIGWLILFLIGFLLQGMEEEVLLRGYFMTSLSTRVPIIAAIWINAIFFACMHLLNPGISVLALINLVLFGLFASVYAVKTNNIWGVCAIHSIWNFVQGNFYGILVSGMDTGISVFKFSSTESGKLINGGSFGLEGGLSVTIVLIIGIVITLVAKNKELDALETTGSEVTE